MQSRIRSLHHVTATVDDAQDDLDFCVETLGMRLVKKTVNFDNHHVYHFYYADERGTPGTIWTTFPYKGKGVPTGRKGAGQVGATSFSVPAGALDFWRARFTERGVAFENLGSRFSEEGISCSDRSGLRFELIATGRDARQPWTGGAVTAEAAIRGLHSVTMTVRSPERTLELMSGLLGFEVVDQLPGRLRIAINGNEPGRTVDIVADPDMALAVNGLGTVHHFAMAIDTAAEQLQLREELLQWGCHVTEVRDRSYFQSIYFREPGGVLLEVATVGPGFGVDEKMEDLGRDLKLPPWEEPHRPAIEAGLPIVSYRS